MKITAKQNPGRPGFRCTFKDPRPGRKLTSCGLGTHDEAEAQRICNDVVMIFSKPALLNDDKNPALLAYHRRAVEIVHGEEAAEELFKRKKKPVLDKSDVDTLGARIIAIIEETDAKDDRQAIIDEMLNGFESSRYKEVQDRCEHAENRVKVLEPMVAEQQAVIDRFRKEMNLHVKVTIGEAVKEWKEYYKPDHADATCRSAFRDIDGFMVDIGKDFLIGEINSGHVDKFLSGLKRKDDPAKNLHPATRHHVRANLSSFFTWACKRFKLFQNPLDNALTVQGLARSAENIQSIRRHEDIKTLIAALEPFPYWQAWAAMACLSGPRWAEMKWLKVDDVYFANGNFRITSRDFNGQKIGTKTGRERNVPIERTLALPIIQRHHELRVQQQARRKGTPAEKSPWLFPSLLPEHPHAVRTKSLIGQWSDNSAWRDEWDEIAVRLLVNAGALKLRKDEIRDDSDTREVWFEKRKRRIAKMAAITGPHKFLTFGPAEWRHTFGTTVFMCGWSGLEISRAMGNSPAIAEQRYISGITPAPDQRWPFKWS